MTTCDPHPENPTPEFYWSSNDDALIRSLAELYVGNWMLVADVFNSSRVLIKTDRRTPVDCYRRWRYLSPKESRAPSEVPSSPAIPPTPTSMMTRGTKRTAAQAAGHAPSANAPTQPKARKRHAIMVDIIRKYAKKRDATAKALGMPCIFCLRERDTERTSIYSSERKEACSPTRNARSIREFA